MTLADILAADPTPHNGSGLPWVNLPTLYKLVEPDGRAPHGGSGRWSLPCYHATSPAQDGSGCTRPDHVRSGDGWAAPGDWWDIEGDVMPCRNALHLTDAEHFEHWDREGLEVYRAEVRGLVMRADHKYAVQSARLLPRQGAPADFAPAEQALDRATVELFAARERADRAYNRAVKAAERAERGVKVPPAWAAYLARVNVRDVPKGHPARAYAERVARVNEAIRAAERKRTAYLAPFEAARMACRRALSIARRDARLAGI